jgi:hypothetical protein
LVRKCDDDDDDDDDKIHIKETGCEDMKYTWYTQVCLQLS